MNSFNKVMDYITSRISVNLLRIGLLLPAIFISSASFAAEPVCAVVKIEIQQELTLERQAFDAVMRINNGLDLLSLEDVNINVTFKDETGASVEATSDTNSTTAKFFIKVDSMSGINAIDGTGTVAPKTTAEVHWLIIPASGAGGLSPSGKLYFVGASLNYNLGGELQTTVVTPDSIYVKPLPLLSLDYFLEKDVFADDAFTPEVEPAIPFTLGVRVKNNGAASATGLKIDSAQPTITENAQGLLIGFNIIGSNVNEAPSTNSLLIDFGEIKPNEATMGRWDMVTTLSGRFTEFTADFSHSDDLGGRLTSIIDPAGINTHTLIRNVRVDLAGRDYVRDFLALDDTVYRVYESSGVDTDVTDISASTTLTVESTGTEPTLSLTMPQTAGFSYAKIPDPFAGTKVVKQMVRSDGKAIPLDNVWTSKTRNLDTNPPSWDYWFNVFDANSTGTYAVLMGEPDVGPVAPEFTPMGNVTTYETATVTFPVSATDANGDAVILTAGTLPAGATFTSDTSGSGTFTWTPSVGQAGNHTISFTASDGTLSKQTSVNIKVNPAWDTDGDGMDDEWERLHFGDLSRDGLGDLDGDGVTDIQEYLNQTDPNLDQPLAPINLVALPGNAENTLSWDTVTGVDSYNVYWNLSADVTPTNGTVLNASMSPFVHSGLDNDVTYYYIVTSMGLGGESAASNVVSVTTGVRDWTAPNVFSNAAGTFSQNVDIAMTANGDAIAVWQQTNIDINTIMASRYVVGTGWSIPVAISNTTLNASNPQVSMDEAGNAIAVWQEGGLTQSDILAARYDVVTGWELAVKIENDGSNAAINPQLAMTKSGNSVVVWQQGSNLYSNRYDVVSGWQTESLLADETNFEISNLAFAINESDDGFATWTVTQDQTAFDLRLSQLSANIWATAITVALGLDGAINPAVTINDSGNALLAWTAFDGTRHDLIASEYTTAGGWTTAQSIGNSLGDAKSPQLVMDATGNAYVTWTQSSSPYSVYVKRYDAVASWQTADVIEQRQRGNASNPQLSLDLGGNVVVTWQQDDGVQQNILAAVYDKGLNSWGKERVIETSNTGHATTPVIAINNSGNAIVAWQQDNAGELVISTNHYEAGNSGIPNIAPITVAGSNQTVDEETSVTLDGSASFDQDGSGLISAYSWAQTEGTAVMLTGADTATPTFDAPSVLFTDGAQTLTFELTVTDDANAASTKAVNVVVNPVNTAPVANAGTEINADEQTTVTLSGSATDNDGTVDSYSWAQISGETVTLTNANTAMATFDVPVVTVQQGVQTLVFELTVTDNEDATATSQVNVLVSPVNAAPIVNAGIDETVNEQTNVTLTGSGIDTDSGVASYSWSHVGGLPVTLMSTNTATTSFIAPVVLVQDSPQAIVLRLTVVDNEGASVSDDVEITVNAVNAVPVVNAGVDTDVNEKTQVNLNATVTDDGSITSYSWAQVGTPTVTLISANSEDASFTAPIVLMQDGPQAITLRLTVVDNEGATVSDDVVITVNPVNANPTVNAGTDTTVDEQTPVSLTAVANDTDGTVDSYSWTQVSGMPVSLIDTTSANLNFAAPTVLVPQGNQNLVFQVVVTDNENAVATDEVIVTVTPINADPTVSAGDNKTVDELTQVIVTGSASDTDGSIITHEWTQTAGTTVEILNADIAIVAFYAPRLKIQETLTFRLTVTDNEMAEDFAEVNVVVNPVNTLPVADAGVEQTIAETLNVVLDGGASNDPDIDGLINSYQWTQTAGITVSLTNANTAVANFTAPAVYQDEELSFRLDIVDDEGGAASATTNVTLFSTNPDDDADGMLDLWEIQYFGNLNRDGKADDDADGATDLMEHDFGTDPFVAQGPGQPEIESPDKVEVTILQPQLTVVNGVHNQNFTTTYQYQVFSDAAMTTLVTEGILVTEGTDSTSWIVDKPLYDNTHYYWRARANGWVLQSDWVSSTFFVNTVNDAPGVFNISAPQDGVWVKSFTPDLSVTNSTDVDEDTLTYHFEVYADQAMTSLMTSSQEMVPGLNGITLWTVDTVLAENTWYTWRAVVTDEHGLSTVSNTASIFINTINDAPSVPELVTPADATEITTLLTDMVVNNSIEPEAEPVTYFFELDTVNTFDSVNKRSSVELAEGLNQTRWFADNLLDNTWYFWRVKASDGRAQSAWMNGNFFVNTVNDAPGIPTLHNPGDNGWVGTMEPSLTVLPAIDIDEDSLNYEFEIYVSDKFAREGVLHSSAISPADVTFWQVSPLLPQDGWYYWRARAIDEHGLAGEWATSVYFYADSDGVNDAPRIKLDDLEREHKRHYKLCNLRNRIEHRVHDWKHKDYHKTYESNCRKYVDVEWKDFDPDSNAFISLYYSNSNEGEGGTLIVEGLREDPDHRQDEYKWDITDLVDGVYFVYAVIDDGTTRVVQYSPNAIIVGDGAGQPYIELENKHQNKSYKKRIKLKWDDIDSDSNASISFYYDTDNQGYDGTLIVSGLEEDPDRNKDQYKWDVSALPEGKYYIYAVIQDETQQLRIYSREYIEIENRKK